MKTEEEFTREFGDEIRGLLLASFYEATRSRVTDHAANGAVMLDQMRRAQELLRRQYQFLSEETNQPTKNGTAQPRKGVHEQAPNRIEPNPEKAVNGTASHGSARKGA